VRCCCVDMSEMSDSQKVHNRTLASLTSSNNILTPHYVPHATISQYHRIDRIACLPTVLAMYLDFGQVETGRTNGEALLIYISIIGRINLHSIITSQRRI